jgi:hypothetical protein
MILTSDAPWLYHGKGLFLLSQENDQFHNLSVALKMQPDCINMLKQLPTCRNVDPPNIPEGKCLTPSLVSSQATSSNPSNDKHQGTSVLWSSIAIPA